MSPGRRAWYAALGWVIRGMLRLLWGTCRVRHVHGEEHLDQLRAGGRAAVIVYWHQAHIFGAWCMRRQARRGLPLAFLTSPSVSGELPAAIVRAWGIFPLRGSSTRDSGEALRQMYELVATRRTSLVITADGPKGPLHECKPGVLMLARIARAPVIPLAYAATPATHWRSWDRFIVPWPFARVALAIGEPFNVPAGAGFADLDPHCRELERRLADLQVRAEALL
jgi:hypothetical protein